MNSQDQMQILVNRYRDKDRGLDSELQNLLNKEIQQQLSVDERILLDSFRQVFEWDNRYVVQCDYHIPVGRISASCVLNNLQEFLALEENDFTDLIDYDDLIVDDADFWGGEVFVEEKEIEVRHLRLK
jgi:hypothetical protein